MNTFFTNCVPNTTIKKIKTIDDKLDIILVSLGNIINVLESDDIDLNDKAVTMNLVDTIIHLKKYYEAIESDLLNS